jgi:TrkA domain protein
MIKWINIFNYGGGIEKKMNIRESELPGVGKKFEMITKNNEKLVIVIHDNGHRELYYFDADDFDEYVATCTLEDDEARQIAAIIGGMTYKPKALESLEITFDELMIEWVKMEKGAQGANQTIGQLKIRTSYGVNVIALLKKNKEKIHSPGPNTLLEEGDTIILSGERKNVKRLVKELLSRSKGAND